MSPDTSNFVSINNLTSPSGRQEFYVHQFQDENGKASKLVYTGDGVGDVNKVAQQYIEQGFDPSKIKLMVNWQVMYLAFKVLKKRIIRHTLIQLI